MRLEFFILIQLISGFMGFLLGRAVREHEANIRHSNDTLRTDNSEHIVFRARNDNRGNDHSNDVEGRKRIRQVDEEGREIK